MTKLFQFALIWNPTEKQVKDEGLKPVLVHDVQAIMANDDKHAQTIAARAIPEKFSDQLDQIMVVIRPF